MVCKLFVVFGSVQCLSYVYRMFADWNSSSVLLSKSVSRIEYPYAIVGIMCAIASILFVVFSFSSTPPEFTIKPRASASTIAIAAGESSSSMNCRKHFLPMITDIASYLRSRVRRLVTSRDFYFRLAVQSLMFVFYLFVIGGTRAYGKFVFSYAVESPFLQLSKSSASWLTFVYWISYTVARLVTVLASRIVTIHLLLFVEVSGMLSASVGLTALSRRREAFWAFTALFGFFQSPLFPSCLGWANQYIEITSTTIMIINLGSSIGGMLVQWLTGYAFQYLGPDSFLYIAVFYSAAIFALFVVMHVVARRHGSRFHTSNKMSRLSFVAAAAAAGRIRTRLHYLLFGGRIAIAPNNVGPGVNGVRPTNNDESRVVATSTDARQLSTSGRKS
jgi:hypothetical protein